jgi:hypothetical protein
MKTQIILILFMFGLLIYGCSKNVTAPQNQNPIKAQNIIMFNQMDSIHLYKDPVSINSIDVDKEMLKVTLNYGGGCGEHVIALYGFSSFLESNPPQADIFLSHNSNGDSCEAWIGREDVFNLEPLLLLCRQQYHNGQILLRVYPPNSTEPIRPLPVVLF